AAMSPSIVRGWVPGSGGPETFSWAGQAKLQVRHKMHKKMSMRQVDMATLGKKHGQDTDVTIRATFESKENNINLTQRRGGAKQAGGLFLSFRPLRHCASA